jgi:hypothetical protein
MNTLKSVFNRIAEEETKLSTHEIELGILQDIEKELITANAGAIKARGNIFKIK